MRNSFTPEKRAKLQQKIMIALEEEVQVLSPELQKILIDDLVTAFENRLKVLKDLQQKPQKTENMQIEDIAEIHKSFI
jgi:predicted RecB family endonuclease